MATLTPLIVSKSTGCNVVRAAQWLPALQSAMDRFQINTPLRQAAFLAQLGHESAGLSAVEENLNYSSDGLLKVFSKYFPTPALAQQYARQPQKIANRVYANRMGNGDEASGDGWNFRGRGPIQITFKNNYAAAGKYLGLDLVSNPSSVTDPKTGCLVAGWYWTTRNLNAYADKGNFDNICDLINLGRATAKVGDAIGYAHRLSLYNAALAALK